MSVDKGEEENIELEAYRDLFLFFVKEHELTLLNSEMDDIIHAVDSFKEKFNANKNVPIIDCTAGKLEHNKSIFHLGQCHYCYGNQIIQ